MLNFKTVKASVTALSIITMLCFTSLAIKEVTELNATLKSVVESEDESKLLRTLSALYSRSYAERKSASPEKRLNLYTKLELLAPSALDKMPKDKAEGVVSVISTYHEKLSDGQSHLIKGEMIARLSDTYANALRLLEGEYDKRSTPAVESIKKRMYDLEWLTLSIAEEDWYTHYLLDAEYGITEESASPKSVGSKNRVAEGTYDKFLTVIVSQQQFFNNYMSATSEDILSLKLAKTLTSDKFDNNTLFRQVLLGNKDPSTLTNDEISSAFKKLNTRSELMHKAALSIEMALYEEIENHKTYYKKMLTLEIAIFTLFTVIYMTIYIGLFRRISYAMNCIRMQLCEKKGEELTLSGDDEFNELVNWINNHSGRNINHGDIS